MKLSDILRWSVISNLGLVLSFVLLVSGSLLVFGQSSSDQIIRSNPVEFKELEREFTVKGVQYVMRQVPFASSNIVEGDSRLKVRGDITLASLSALYYYDGKSVRELSLPPDLITEHTSSLHHLADGWYAVGSDIINRGESQRGITFFNEHSKECLAPCVFGDYSGICETAFYASGKIGEESMILSAEEGLYIVRKDSVRLLPETEGYHLLGSFDTLALAYIPKSGQCKMIAYQEHGVQMKPLSGLPIGYTARWARKVGDQLFVGNNSRSDYYTLTLDEEGSSPSGWIFSELPKGKNISRFFSDHGLIALLEDNRYYRLTASGPVYSDLHNEIANLIGDDRLVTSIHAGQSSSSSSIFATKKGLAVVTKKNMGTRTSFPRQTLQGYSTRQMYADRAENALWVTSYSDLIKLNLTSLPDTLIQRAIPHLQEECFGPLNFNFRSNKWGMIAVDGWKIKYFDHATDRCAIFQNPSPDKRRIFGLEETSDGSFIIGTTTGLFLLRPAALNDGLVPVPVKAAGNSERVMDQKVSVQRLKRIQGSDTLLICSSAGLYIALFEGGFFPKLNLVEKVTEKSIHDAHLLPDGSLLVATERKGLLWLSASPDRSLIHAFNRDNYLRSNYIHNIQEDSQGRIWLSSNDGLYVINLEDKRLAALGKDEGFPSDEFNRISSAVLTDSLMVFGGVKGLSFFNPHDFSFPVMAQRSSVAVLKVQRDSQLVVVSPSGTMDSVPYFDLPVDASSFQAVIDAPLFSQTRNVKYRWISDSGFWRAADHGQIPVPAEMEQQTLQLKWNIGLDQYIYSEIRVGQRSEGSLFYIKLALALLVVLAAVVILLLRLRPQKNPDSENALEPGEKKNTAETEALPSPLSEREKLSLELEKKEMEVYLFPTTGGSSLLENTLSYVKSEMSTSNFSVNEVAKHINLSSRQFHRRIIEETGLTPNQLFTLIRLRHSKDALISDSSLTVTELANQAGYNNPSYFSKKFKKFYGYSPKELSQKLIKMGKA